MALKTTIKGREALNRRLRAFVPEAEKAAELIENAAPLGETGDYRASIVGDYQANNPSIAPVGGKRSSDPDATGVYASFIWRFLEFGTKPHSLARNASRARGLRQDEGGMHPGTPAQPHIFPTWRSYRPKALRKVRDAINRAIRENRKK
jgi:hypothetical protein